MNTATSADAPVQDSAEQALSLMRRQGFHHAQVRVVRRDRHELCVAHNHASLMRSATSHQLQLTGLLDGRRADIDGSELDAQSLRELVHSLWSSVAAAPQDDANAVSAGQSAQVAAARSSLTPRHWPMRWANCSTGARCTRRA